LTQEPETELDHSDLILLQARINSLLTHLFKYWVKKKNSRYLRLQEFYKNFVIFGLAPSYKFIENVIETFQEKVIKPGFSMPPIPEGQKVPNLAELRNCRPFNEFFVYQVQNNGKLVASHISLATILNIFQINKHCFNLQELLKNRLKAIYLKNLSSKLSKNNYTMDSAQM
jgi:hypothetical protein